MRENRSYQREKVRIRPKSKWGRGRVWVRSVWKREQCVSIERYLMKWEKNRAEATYRKHEARWIERYWELSSTNSQHIYLLRCYWELSTAKRPWWIEQLSRIYWADRKFLDGSRICWEAIETNSQKFRWIEVTLTSIEKGSSKISINSLVVEMSKNSFLEKRKTQIWMQSSMLFNQRSNQHFKLSKTSLNKKNVKHLDPKYTHILNKFNQFYISKTSQNSLVSIH